MIAMKKKKFSVLLILMLCVFAIFMCACSEKTSEKTDEAEDSRPKRKIIIDTDTGADDASALILAAKSDDIDILGVTTNAGNVDLKQSTLNALMALEVAGSDAPVYKGTDKTYSGKTVEAFSVFGKDGMGDAGLIHTSAEAQSKDAVSYILDSIRKYPGEIEIVALGPVTNIAKAIDKDPETMKKVKRIWSMGTAGLGPGNASPVADFNVYKDAEAYRVLMESGLPVTVIGLDMCDGEAMWSGEQFDELEKSGETGSFVARSFTKLCSFYKENGSEDLVMNCDSVAMMCVLQPDFIKDSANVYGSCITEKGETYAQVIFYKEGFQYDIATNDHEFNTTLITEVDKATYFDRYKEAVAE